MAKRKSKMNQSEIECILCEQIKPRKEYYSTSSYCKACHKEYMSDKSITNRRKFLHKCIANNKLKLEHFDAADRLLISCQSRYNACKYNMGIYKDIECNYATPFEFFLVLLDKEEFFEKWIDLYNCWIASGKNRNALPVIDRIDEKGHYISSNVQPLTHLENTQKANSNSILFFLWKRRGLREIARGRFDSVSELKRYIDSSNNSNLPADANVNVLIDKALKVGTQQECAGIEFSYKEDRYLVQLLLAQK